MAKMLGLQPKMPRPDPALAQQRESERAATAKTLQSDVIMQQDRLNTMFGGRSLLGSSSSGGSSGGTMASLGSNWLSGLLK